MSVRANQYWFDFTHTASVRWGRRGTAIETRATNPTPLYYFVDDRKIAGRFGQVLAPLLADWIDIALALYLADRLALRQDFGDRRRSLQWGRVLEIKVAVRKLEIWRRSDIAESLVRVLRYLTEDDWRLEFVPRTGAGRISECQGFLFSSAPPRPVRVALYSGGLDSFAGAAHQLSDCPGDSFVFVSGVTHTRQRSGQRQQLAALSRTFGRQIWHVAVPYGFHWARSFRRHREEASQRTRGFLFLTLGITTALATNVRELYVYENGVGAINLPYDGTQIGTANSRAIHPVTLRRMEAFVQNLVGPGFRISNPFLFSTKAEICRHPPVQGLREHIPLTFSCDGFPVRARGRAQCGSCTSCILRRVSLERAGLSSFDRTGYLNDLPVASGVAGKRQRDVLHTMAWQAHRIRAALAKEHPWEALVSEFVELQDLAAAMSRADGRDVGEVREKLMRLYGEYATEWANFSALYGPVAVGQTA